MGRNETPYSELKIFYHHELLCNLMKEERCAPVYIRIKPTNRCNHDCSYCHYKHSYVDLDEYKPMDEIPRHKMREIISDMADMGVKAVTFTGGGEPLLYSHIEEAMEGILNAGIDLSAITNGSLLKGRKAELLAKAKWVRISVESLNDAMYCKIRGIKPRSFEQLCENIENFARIKEETCEFGINVVVGKDNCHEVRAIAELMKKLGVNHVKFSPLITVDTKQYHKDFRVDVSKELEAMQLELADENFKIIDLYTGDFENSVVFERSYSKCFRKEFECVIAANSRLYYCQDTAYMGKGMVCDLSEASLKESWYSDEVTEKFKQFDAKKICTHNCAYDSRNQLIGTFLKMDLNHINFI